MNIDRLLGRVRNSIARAVLRLVDDGPTLQSVQVETHADVVRDSAEHFQHYGFTSVPFPGAEGIALAVGGSTDHTVVINVDDRRHRIQGLAPGEVALFTDEDQLEGGHRIHFKRGQRIEIHAGVNHIILSPDGIRIVTPSFDIDQGDSV